MRLAEVAITHGHAALAGYIFGQRHKWRFCQSTMRELRSVIAPLEEAIRQKFIPALFIDNSPISDLERELYALPARFGGMSIGNPIEECPERFAESAEMTSQLTELLLSGEAKLCIDEQTKVHQIVGKESRRGATANESRSDQSPIVCRPTKIHGAGSGKRWILSLHNNTSR